MANKILLRRNSTASAAPTAAQIEPGELAINTADGRLFTELNNGTIVNLPVQSIAGQAISPSSVTTTGALDTPNVKSKIYTAVTGDAGGWYPLFTIDIDQVITCSLRTLYHSSVLFTVSISYSAPAITVLHSSIQPNSSYANVNAIRINGGVVEVKLNWITGPSVQISAQISGSGTLPNFAATLVQNTNVVTPADSVDLVDKQTRFTRLRLSGTTASTSTTTGALVVDGGAGVAGTLWAADLGATAFATIGAANSTRINIAGVGGANAVSEYYLTEVNPRWQIGRDLITGGLAGYGAIPSNNTLAAGGVAFGLAAARELGLYTSNGSVLTERVRVDSSGLVGINTNDPQDRLHLNGNQTTLRLQSGTAYDTQVRFIDTQADWSVGLNVTNNAGNGFFTIRSNTASAHRLTIDTNGNVGINQTSPGSRLVVKGSGITSAGSALNVTNSNDNSMLFVRNDGYVGISTASPTARLTVFGLGTGTMECGATGHGGNYTGISFNNSGNSNVGVNIFSSPTDQTLYFNRPSGNSIRFREANVDQVIIASNGDVGIGTLTPAAPLTIRKDVGTTTSPGAVFGDMIAFKAYYTGFDTETVKAAIGSGVDGITNWNTRNGLLTFSTSNGGTLTERMRIMASGNVGISQTEPATKLDISHAGGFGLRINNTNTGGHYWSITPADGGFSSGNDRLLFIPNNVSSSTAAKVAFKTDGAIGAGTYDPQGMLHANSTAALSTTSTKIENLVLTAGNGSAIGARHGIQFRANNSIDTVRVCGIYQTVEYASANATGLAFHTSAWTGASTSDQERVRIASSGNVGIGVTAPASRLVVKGEGITTATSALNVTDLSDASLLFVRNDGNVGIGQAAPNYKLEVNGSFAATTKSFRIKHPSKPNHILEYGSLESPYHGVRLTGRGKVIGSSGQVALPEYLKNLVHDDERVTIQLTNYRHGKLLYVSAIDLQHDAFFVACDTSSDTDLEFFWCLTAVRKDIDEMVVERHEDFGF